MIVKLSTKVQINKIHILYFRSKIKKVKLIRKMSKEKITVKLYSYKDIYLVLKKMQLKNSNIATKAKKLSSNPRGKDLEKMTI